MRIHLLFALTSLIAGASVAAAQPADPPPPDPSQPQPPPPPPDESGGTAVDASGSVGVGVGVGVQPGPPPGAMVTPPPLEGAKEKGILEDANSGRNWLTPTALLPPEGTWSVSDFELFLAGAGYSPTDQLHISITTLLPIVDEMPFWFLLSGKLQLIDQGQFKLAAQGTLTFFGTDDIDDELIWTYGGSVGGAATYCLDADCYSHLTGYLAAAFARDSGDSAVPFIVGAAAVFKVARRVRLVFEADSGFVLGDINENIDGFLGWYGVRFTSRNIGVDLGFVKPVYYGDAETDDPLLLGLPFVSFTYRGVPGDD